MACLREMMMNLYDRGFFVEYAYNDFPEKFHGVVLFSAYITY
jgi:hypothetical protein